MPLKKYNNFSGIEIALWDVADEEVLEFDKQLAICFSSQDVYFSKAFMLRFQKLSLKRKKEFMGIHLCLDRLGIKKPLKYTTNGKPFIESGGFISISHSFGVVAVALSEQGEIGIDIEKKRDVVLKVQHKFVHSEELKFIDATNTKLYVQAIWCIKEAIYKIYGGDPYLSFLDDIRVSQFHLMSADWIQCIVQVGEKKETLRAKLIDFDQFMMAFAEKTANRIV